MPLQDLITKGKVQVHPWEYTASKGKKALTCVNISDQPFAFDQGTKQGPA